MRLIALAVPLLFLGIAACGSAPPAPNVKVEQAWIRLPASPGQPAAGYFSAAATTSGETLLDVTSPSARVEMHETVTNGGMAEMVPLPEAPFLDGELRFAPGGRHLMLMELDPQLKPGGSLALSFKFKQAPPVTVQAHLMAAGDASMEHGAH